MTYKGHVEKGVIVLDEPVQLEDGAEVTIEFCAGSLKDEHSHRPFSERYADIIGKAEELPEDASSNYEHYLYGLPKQ